MNGNRVYTASDVTRLTVWMNSFRADGRPRWGVMLEAPSPPPELACGSHPLGCGLSVLDVREGPQEFVVTVCFTLRGTNSALYLIRVPTEQLAASLGPAFQSE